MHKILGKFLCKFLISFHLTKPALLCYNGISRSCVRTRATQRNPYHQARISSTVKPVFSATDLANSILP
jgi:hypothetical protein